MWRDDLADIPFLKGHIRVLESHIGKLEKRVADLEKASRPAANQEERDAMAEQLKATLMDQQRKGGGRKPTSKETLGRELDAELGEDEAKELCQDIALVIANHKLTRRPELCEKVFRYMSGVVSGWNERYR